MTRNRGVLALRAVLSFDDHPARLFPGAGGIGHFAKNPLFFGLGRVDLRRAKIGDQQLIAAEDIQRQEALLVIVAMEKPALLSPMHGIIGGIEIQDQPVGWCRERGDELLQEDLMDGPGRSPIRAVF